MKSSAPKSQALPETVRIFLVDDHPIFRRGLARYLECEPRWQVCGEAASTATALDGLRRVQAEIAVVDIALPGANGLELIKGLHAEHPALRILVVSAHEEEQYALRALRAGAFGYVMKREAEATIMEALHRIAAGTLYVSPSISERIIQRAAGTADGDRKSPLEGLSDRELEVLQLVGEGRTSREIAAGLCLSVKTIESHRLNIQEKLDLRNSTALVHFAHALVSDQRAA